MDTALPSYYPFMHGVYDVKAGIASLGRDLGNGERDRLVFQRDQQFPAYYQAKLEATTRPERHILRDRFDPQTEQAVSRWIAVQLKREHPELDLACSSSLDNLALHVQEDLAVLMLDDDGLNRLAYLHVCMPSGWSPEEKIGRPFDAVHAPVPYIEPLSAKQGAIARLMVNATRGAVRFAWTITTDAALNHHPLRDPADHAAGPTPLPDHPPGEPLLRVERQVIWGFPEHQAALFTIRTYLYPFADLGPASRVALASAVAGMSAASLRYKNMDRAMILARLGS